MPIKQGRFEHLSRSVFFIIRSENALMTKTYFSIVLRDKTLAIIYNLLIVRYKLQ